MAEKPMLLPPDKQILLTQILELLSTIPGVQAVVLGGSYARGTARTDSDLDIGIYYSEKEPFAIGDIRKAAIQLSGDENQAVTDFYVWGAWVNGGAWIHTSKGKVDFLYRNVEQVQKTIAEAQQGITHHDFDQQPPFGFYSVMYLAEISICLPLFDPQGTITRLKNLVATYPEHLKEKTVASTLWMAEFSLLHAEGYARAGNVYATAGTLTRVASYLTQALFAINETYFISDKTVMRDMENFSHLPQGFPALLSQALSHIGITPPELLQAVGQMHSAWKSVVALTEGSYHPAFKI